MISVSIWRKTLVRRNACADGLALFDAIAAQQPANDKRRLERIRIRNWTPLHGLWAWIDAARFAQWCEARQIIPRADLTYADLSGADLSGANLSRANLSRSDLSGAILSRADLSGAYRGTSPKVPGWHTLVSGHLERETETSSQVSA